MHHSNTCQWMVLVVWLLLLNLISADTIKQFYLHTDSHPVRLFQHSTKHINAKPNAKVLSYSRAKKDTVSFVRTDSVYISDTISSKQNIQTIYHLPSCLNWKPYILSMLRSNCVGKNDRTFTMNCSNLFFFHCFLSGML